MREFSRPRPSAIAVLAQALLPALLLALAGCGPDADSPPSSLSGSPSASAPSSGTPSGPRPVATAAADEEPAAPAKPFVLVLLGDSLSAGQGLPADASFSAQLARELTRQGVLAEVRNASVAGDDAADGLARFDAATPEDADGVLIELGADDLARGTAPESVEASLSALIERAQSRGLWVGLIGLSAPSASDADYAAAFNAMYDELARDHGVELYPDYYSGLIDRETGEARPELFLEDGVHPTDLGVAIVAEGVADWLSDSLPRAARRGG